MRSVLPLVILGLLASGSALAQETQYRHFKLSDGRELDAIILATEAAGFHVRVPQGEMAIPFNQLYDMTPIGKDQYESQPDWVVYLAVPEERRKGLATVFEAIPHVQVLGTADAPVNHLSADEQRAAYECGTDLACVARATANAPWMWIVSARQDGSELVLSAQTNKGGGQARNPIRVAMIQPDRIVSASWELLEVDPAEAGPTTAAVPATTDAAGPTGPTPTQRPVARAAVGRDRLLALSYAPVPGLPSLARGDYGGFGLAMATALPATALWVGVAGKTAQSSPQHAVLAVGGFYAITVAVNQAVGLRGMDGDMIVGLEPTQKGGAALRLTVAR